VERKITRPVPPDAGLIRTRQKVPDCVESLDVRHRVAPGRPPDGTLVDHLDVVDQVMAPDGVVRADRALTVERALDTPQSLIQRIVDQRRLARSADSRHTYERTEREPDRQALQIVLA